MTHPLVSRLLHDPVVSYPRATVACFDPTCGELPRRKLDGGRTVQFLERLAAAGAPAVLIAASTGHGHLRTPAELAEWFRVAAKAQLGSCVRTALLRPEDGREENARLLDLLAELAYPVVFVRPGTNVGRPFQADKDGPEGPSYDRKIADNMRPIVEMGAQRGLAIGLYSIPDVSGCAMSPDAAAMLVQGPGGQNIVAIKITESSYEASTQKFLNDPRLARLKIVQGWDPFLARARREGGNRCGVTSGPMSLAVFQYLHMFAAADRGDWDELAIAQTAVTALFQAMQDDVRKFADLQRAKFIMGLGQPLAGTVTSEQVERVLSTLRTLPRAADRKRLARSLDLMEDGPFHAELARLAET
ncbi:MAG TPA: dihydrodipicolinate synthase family protein [Pirellulaceae bacterium]|nr:dihydrodipicolinate synthase family protein [Pirellulaceae bacterium]